MKNLLTFILLIVSVSSFGQASTDTLTFPIDKKCEQCLDTALIKTSDMMNCFAAARDSWSKEVTKYYELLMTKLKPEQKEKLISAQKEWTAYKEKEFELCSSIYYDEEQGHEKRIDAVSRESQIVRQRALDLIQYYDLYLEK
jgi:uncharacterized protein YecT (DUF1311 family)